MECKMRGLLFGLFLFSSAASIKARSPALILTPYLKANHIELARNDSVVDSAYFLNITSHSGFLTVDERYNSNLFFWYFPVASPKKVEESPWIVWLQGGPGASSIAGLFDEIGPFHYRRRTLKNRDAAWTKHHSVLFIDNPVGAGFSFTNSQNGFVQDMSTCATHLYKVLQQFLTMFPELKKAPLYLAGESYAGRFIPALAMKILDQDIELGPLDVNLQGIILGNPVISREAIADYINIFYQWGLIDSQGALAVKPLQDALLKALKEGDSEKALELRNKLLDRLDDMSLQLQNFNILEDNLEDALKSFIDYITYPTVQDAIHAGDLHFAFHNLTAHQKLSGDFIKESNSVMGTLLDHYRVLVYCGQLDLTAPCVPNAEDRRKKWFWSKRNNFLNAPRTPWWYNNSVAGYVKTGGGFTEALIRGAGHLVPMDKPAQTLQLISYFIRGLDMPLPPNYQVQKGDTPEYEERSTENDYSKYGVQGIKITMILSIVVNILLVIAILAGLVLCLRWKHRVDMFSYNNVQETTINESVLALS